MKTPLYFKEESELTFEDLMKIKSLAKELPFGFNVCYCDATGKRYFFDEYLHTKVNDFFGVSAKKYKSIEGKCFTNSNVSEIIKVYSVNENSERPEEFLFEKFICDSYNKWYPEDYIWLQDAAETSEEHRKLCTTEFMNLNINSENMLILGKDGNLYLDTTCENDYIAYKPCKEYVFDVIRQEVVENLKEDKNEQE